MREQDKRYTIMTQEERIKFKIKLCIPIIGLIVFIKCLAGRDTEEKEKCCKLILVSGVALVVLVTLSLIKSYIISMV